MRLRRITIVFAAPARTSAAVCCAVTTGSRSRASASAVEAGARFVRLG
jgi:mRNA-degrading endonuclease toxin of MazEF toxin-antitoxin module